MLGRPNLSVTMARGSLVVFGLLLGACTLLQPEVNDCATDSECADLIGYGSACQTGGRCSDPFACSSDEQCLAEFGQGSRCGETNICSPPFACTQNYNCREEFGVGSYCRDDGRCSAPGGHPRCSRTYPEDFFARPLEYRDRLVVGTLFDYQQHETTLLATELAARQVGLLDGRGFAMVHCDHGANVGDGLSDIEATREMALYLSEQLDVRVIVGPRGSTRTQEAFEATRSTESVIISPSATSVALTALDGLEHSDEAPGLLWRTCSPDNLQARVMAYDMRDRDEPLSHVAVIYQQGPYGEGLVELFGDEFLVSAGLNSQVDLYPYVTTDSPAFADALVQVGSNDAEEILFISSDLQDTITFYNTITTTALQDQFLNRSIFLPDAAYDQRLIESLSGEARRALGRTRGTRPASPEGTLLYRAFSAAYFLAFDLDASASAFSAHSYDAAWLAFLGIAWAHYQEEAITGVGIARGLRRISSGTAIEIRPNQWSNMIRRFELGQSIDVEGASGQLDYDPLTEETTGPIEVWSLRQDGSQWVFESDYVIEP